MLPLASLPLVGLTALVRPMPYLESGNRPPCFPRPYSLPSSPCGCFRVHCVKRRDNKSRKTAISWPSGRAAGSACAAAAAPYSLLPPRVTPLQRTRAFQTWRECTNKGGRGRGRGRRGFMIVLLGVSTLRENDKHKNFPTYSTNMCPLSEEQTTIIEMPLSL